MTKHGYLIQGLIDALDPEDSAAIRAARSDNHLSHSEYQKLLDGLTDKKYDAIEGQ